MRSNQKMCSTLFAGLIVIIFWNDSLKRVSSADVNGYVYNGKIFKIQEISTDFANAADFCQRDGGRLAKIDSELNLKFLEAPMSQFLSSRDGDACVWIGATDLETEGLWIWTDGTDAKSILWTVDRHFQKFQKYWLDCARLCQRSARWAWTQYECDKSSIFLCEYDEPAIEPTVTPAMKPKVKPVWKPNPKPLGQKSTRTVIFRMPDNGVIQGDPVFTSSAPMATVCSRFCSKKETCAMFNFEKSTGECRGYTSEASAGSSGNSNWEVWILRRL